MNIDGLTATICSARGPRIATVGMRLGKRTVSHFKTFALLLTLVSAVRAFGYASEPVLPWPGDNPPGKAMGNTSITQASARTLTSVGTTEPEMDPEAAAAQNPENQFQGSPIQQFLDMMMGGEKGAAGNQDLGNFGGTRFDSSGYANMNQIVGSGKMEHCGAETPAQVKAAFDEATAFRASCGAAQRGTQQKIAINDYSSKSQPPTMYIFDLQGNCLGKTAVSYGNGGGVGKVPIACNTDGSHMTPAGFHLTSYHDGNGKYNPTNSVGLIGLEGQQSAKRGVIIHIAKRPGTASSWGCSGVGAEAFGAVKSTLGFGSLVYNYFGSTSGCGNNKGLPGLPGNHNRCQMDSGGARVPASSTAGGAPSLVEGAK